MSSGSVKISNEAVEAVAKALNPDLFSDDEDALLPPVLRNSGRWQKRHEVRAALEAAGPKLAGPMPTRQQIAAVIDRSLVSNPAVRDRIADAVLALLNGLEAS